MPLPGACFFHIWRLRLPLPQPRWAIFVAVEMPCADVRTMDDSLYLVKILIMCDINRLFLEKCVQKIPEMVAECAIFRHIPPRSR